MPPIRRRRKPVATTKKSPYETPICKLLVGEDEALFSVPTGLLELTSFFRRHGPPKPKEPVEIPAPSSALPATAATMTAEMFSDSQFERRDREGTAETIPENIPAIDLTDEDADYILRGRFYYSRDAFVIFMRHLNGATPVTPQDNEDCISLFKTYALAQYYDAKDLQNQVIDALQKFYMNSAIPICDLIYIANHWSDETKCVLKQYIIRQTAYEMASDWSEYRTQNPAIVELLNSTRHIILDQLLSAVMEHTKPLASADPAKHKQSFRI